MHLDVRREKRREERMKAEGKVIAWERDAWRRKIMITNKK